MTRFSIPALLAAFSLSSLVLGQNATLTERSDPHVVDASVNPSPSPTIDCYPGICAANDCTPHTKRSIQLDQRDIFGQGLALSQGGSLAAASPAERAKRGLPGGDSADQWVSTLFNNQKVLGASGETTDLVKFEGDQTPTSRFDAFGNKPFSAGMTYLVGCTAIVVVSKKGVWTSHYWQGTFGNADTTPTNNALWTQFKTYVLDSIAGIKGYGSEYIWLALTQTPKGTFDMSEEPQVLIFTPESNDPAKAGKQMYPNQVAAIQQQIKDLMKGLPPGALHTFTYKAVSGDRDKAMQTTAQGKVVTNYDPDAYGKGIHGYQTWAEGKVALQDKWS